jgi:hypothetical protein
MRAMAGRAGKHWFSHRQAFPVAALCKRARQDPEYGSDITPFVASCKHRRIAGAGVRVALLGQNKGVAPW